MVVLIVVHDNIVVIDGEARAVNCSHVNPMVRIVRWDSTTNKGWVEFHNEPGLLFNRNGQLASAADFAEYQPLVSAWQGVGTSAPVVEPPPVINPPPEENPDSNYAAPVFPPPDFVPPPFPDLPQEP